MDYILGNLLDAIGDSFKQTSSASLLFLTSNETVHFVNLITRKNETNVESVQVFSHLFRINQLVKHYEEYSKSRSCFITKNYTRKKEVLLVHLFTYESTSSLHIMVVYF